MNNACDFGDIHQGRGHIMGVSEGDKGLAEKTDLMLKTFLNTQPQKAQRSPNKLRNKILSKAHNRLSRKREGRTMNECILKISRASSHLLENSH